MKKRIAIHQPNYLPWPGYFLKLMLSDTFVFLDHVQFSKPSYTQRTAFRLPNGKSTFLSIPTASSSNKMSINTVVPSNGDWRSAHRIKLKEWLVGYQYYDDLNFLWTQYEDSSERSLADFNLQVIELLAAILDIKFHSFRSSTFSFSSSGTKLIVDILKNHKATQYITGDGFLNYYTESDWSENIALKVIDFKKLIDDSELSSHSIIESIAKIGLIKTKYALTKICNNINC